MPGSEVAANWRAAVGRVSQRARGCRVAGDQVDGTALEQVDEKEVGIALTGLDPVGGVLLLGRASTQQRLRRVRSCQGSAAMTSWPGLGQSTAPGAGATAEVLERGAHGGRPRGLRQLRTVGRRRCAAPPPCVTRGVDTGAGGWGHDQVTMLALVLADHGLSDTAPGQPPCRCGPREAVSGLSRSREQEAIP